MCSFVEALFQRYDDTKAMEECHCEIFVVGGLSPAKSGNHLVLPPALSLNGCRIARAGPEVKIRDFCQNVEELDLGCNSLTDLNEVLKIIRRMPNLRFLNLSENNLREFALNNGVFDASNLDESCFHENLHQTNESQSQIAAEEHHRWREKFQSIRSLVLNNTQVPWSAIRALLNWMPNIEHLHLSLNNYSAVELDPIQKYYNVKRLYISGNPNLRDWHEINKLCLSFPCLDGLSMADCSIDTIDTNLRHTLPHLQFLNITNWPIDSWPELEKLNELPNLTELRCCGIKVLNDYLPQASMETRRQHLIARLPNIKVLNGSEVFPDERNYAEIAFIRWYVVNDHLEKPQRFYELHAIHGRVDPLADVDFSPPRFAEVELLFETAPTANQQDQQQNSTNDDSNGSMCETQDQQPQHQSSATVMPMKIDLNKSVKDFKSQLSSIFGLSPSQMRVFYVDHEMVDIVGPEELKFNQKKLYTYNVQDGDQFIIDSK